MEDNSLKHNKFIPGVKIPIKSKKIVTSLSLSDDSKYAVAFVTISL